MDEQKKPSPWSVLWTWAGPYHSGFVGSILLAILSVACGMLPYLCVAEMIRLLLVEQIYRAFKISRGEKYHW